MWIVLAAAADYEAATNWCRTAGSQCTVKHATQSLHENKKLIWLMLKKKQQRRFTRLSSFVKDSVASMNFLFLSWWRSSI